MSSDQIAKTTVTCEWVGMHTMAGLIISSHDDAPEVCESVSLVIGTVRMWSKIFRWKKSS